jgi:1,2-diacylglycerol 3-alpha-glucosyltransferase
MKVLITTECYVPTINGVVVSTMNLKNELMKRGHEVKILTLSETRHSYEKEGVIYIGSAGASIVYPEARITFPRNNGFIDEIINWHPDGFAHADGRGGDLRGEEDERYRRE